MKRQKISTRLAALGLAGALVLGLLAGCSSKLEAATMHLKRTEGSVRVFDGAGKDLEPARDLGLYSGYEVNTRGGSYAWIDLDEVKLTKMDQDSAIEIQKEGRHLTIDVKFGSLFFNVTRPLDDDETMEIRTSTMVVGIRGTCGWVEVPDEGRLDIYLLEGKVECAAGEETITVNAGEMAQLQEDEPIEVKEFTAAEVKDFVKEEAEDTLLEALPGGGDDDDEGEEPTLFPEESEEPGERWDITSTVGDITVDGENVEIHGEATTGHITINSGYVEIYDNVIAGGILVNGGTLCIRGGAMVSGVLVYGGNVAISGNAMVASLTVEGGFVSLEDNAEIVVFLTHNGGTIDDKR